MRITRSLFSLAFAFVIGLSSVNAQQLPLYSQYMFNTLEINPAYAGFKSSMNFTGIFRKQFNGAKDSPQTAYIAGDMPIGDTNMGVGLTIVDDKFSVTKTFGAQGSYSYRIQTGDYSQLSMGIQVGALNYKANLTQLLVTDPGDPTFQQDLNSIAVNIGAGLFFNTDKFYAGLSSPNLYRGNLKQTNIALTNSDVRQNLHAYLNTGVLLYLNDNFVLKPSVLVRAVQGIPINYDVNANVFMRELFSMGISYRNKSAIVGLMDWKVISKLRVGYSYDYNISRVNTFTKGTHEIILRYSIPFWKDELLPSYLF
jgi:type IX secretion system PorP/SprF family membrane protein